MDDSNNIIQTSEIDHLRSRVMDLQSEVARLRVESKRISDALQVMSSDTNLLSSAQVTHLRALLANVPSGPWAEYSEEGASRRSPGSYEHSVCAYAEPDHPDHVCVATSIGKTEKQAYDIATFIAAAHTLLGPLLDEVEKFRGLERK